MNDAVKALVIDPDTLKANDAVKAYEDDNEYEALVEPEAYDALNILLEPKGPQTLEAVMNEAVEANKALDALCAQLAVPKNPTVLGPNDAEIAPLTNIEPVNVIEPLVKKEPVKKTTLLT